MIDVEESKRVSHELSRRFYYEWGLIIINQQQCLANINISSKAIREVLV